MSNMMTKNSGKNNSLNNSKKKENDNNNNNSKYNNSGSKNNKSSSKQAEMIEQKSNTVSPFSGNPNVPDDFVPIKIEKQSEKSNEIKMENTIENSDSQKIEFASNSVNSIKTNTQTETSVPKNTGFTFKEHDQVAAYYDDVNFLSDKSPEFAEVKSFDYTLNDRNYNYFYFIFTCKKLQRKFIFVTHSVTENELDGILLKAEKVDLTGLIETYSWSFFKE